MAFAVDPNEYMQAQNESNDSQELKNIKKRLEFALNILTAISSEDSELVKEVAAILEDAEKLDEKLQKTSDDAQSKIKELAGKFQERFEELKEYADSLEQRLRALTLPPFVYAKYVRFAQWQETEEGDEIPIVDIMDSRGELRRVPMNTEINPEDLAYGQRVLCAQTQAGFVVMEYLDEFDLTGEEAFVESVHEEDNEAPRVVVAAGDLDRKLVVHLAASVDAKLLEPGKRVLVDTESGLLLEILPDSESQQYIVAEIPDVTFDDIGGLDTVIDKIQEDLVYQITHPEINRQLQLEAPKGVVLEGPPGVGKTMVAKAVVNFMSDKLKEKEGEDAQGYFFHIRGPELQSKWVGETERQMRQIFAEAKKRSSPTNPVIIFFDEMDALFPRRGSGISSDTEKTNVPQFNALMDGLDDRGNIFVIGATNRFDQIDQAVVRPGRFDMVVKIPHPGPEAAREIFAKYLTPEIVHPKYEVAIYTPTDRNGNPRMDENGNIMEFKFDKDPQKAADWLIERAVERMYDEKEPKNEFIRIYFSDGTSQVYRYGDFASGALIKNVVDRAKKLSRRAYFKDGEELGIQSEYLYKAIEEVYDQMRSPSTSRDLVEWFLIEGKMTKEPVRSEVIDNDNTSEEENEEPEL